LSNIQTYPYSAMLQAPPFVHAILISEKARFHASLILFRLQITWFFYGNYGNASRLFFGGSRYESISRYRLIDIWRSRQIKRAR